MLERVVPILRILCLALAGLVIYQASDLATRKDPLKQLDLPALQTLASLTNSPLPGTNTSEAKTNSPANSTNTATPGTNTTPAANASKATTNSATPGTNAPKANAQAEANSTNALVLTNKAKPAPAKLPAAATNEPTGVTNASIQSTNAPATAKQTNLTAATTNVPPSQSSGTNAEGPSVARGTSRRVGGSSTNAATRSGSAGGRSGEPPVPPAVQARIDKVVQAEIFASIQRPPPMALMGIGGRDVFLRGPNGETGLLRVGEELGGVKLLRIGTNRVLVEHEGQQKELMIFSGFGSESLLGKEKTK